MLGAICLISQDGLLDSMDKPTRGAGQANPAPSDLKGTSRMYGREHDEPIGQFLARRIDLRLAHLRDQGYQEETLDLLGGELRILGKLAASEYATLEDKYHNLRRRRGGTQDRP